MTLTSMSKSRGATTLRELIGEVTTMAKLGKKEMILAMYWIRGGIDDAKNAWRV